MDFQPVFHRIVPCCVVFFSKSSLYLKEAAFAGTSAADHAQFLGRPGLERHVAQRQRIVVPWMENKPSHFQVVGTVGNEFSTAARPTGISWKRCGRRRRRAGANRRPAPAAQRAGDARNWSCPEALRSELQSRNVAIKIDQSFAVFIKRKVTGMRWM